eukprot:gene7883-5663_t
MEVLERPSGVLQMENSLLGDGVEYHSRTLTATFIY